MVASEITNTERLTGAVLVMSFVVFAVGGILPTLGTHGHARIFTLPAHEHLLAVARNATVWRWANVCMGAAAIILLAGLFMLTTLLELAGERRSARLGLAGWLASAVLWVIFSVFRGTVTLHAAQELRTTGDAPASYEPLARLWFGVFVVSAAIGFLALAAYGGALLQTTLVPAWAGWATLLFSLVLLVQLLITGDTLPAFHYLPPLIIGVLLLSHR